MVISWRRLRARCAPRTMLQSLFYRVDFHHAETSWHASGKVPEKSFQIRWHDPGRIHGPIVIRDDPGFVWNLKFQISDPRFQICAWNAGGSRAVGTSLKEPRDGRRIGWLASSP